MNDLHKLKARRAKLRQLEKSSHIRPVPNNVDTNRHLGGDVDQGTLAFADMSQEYSKRIQNADVSVSREEVQALFKSFDDNIDSLDHILEPVFLSLLDGTMRAFKVGTKQGITATRLYSECKSFSYDNPNVHAPMLDSYTEYLNEKEYIKKHDSRTKYNKGKLVYHDGSKSMNMRDDSKMSKAHQDHFNGGLTATDGYDGNKEIYESSSHAKGIDKYSQRTEIDHAVPCAIICNNLKKNKVLTDSDIKEIINSEENLVATSFENNRGKNIGKSDKTEAHLREEIDKGYIVNKKGNKVRDLTDEELLIRVNMANKMKEVQKEIDSKTNNIVLKNLFSTDSTIKKNAEDDYVLLKSSQGKKIKEKNKQKYVEKKLQERKEVRVRIAKDAGGAAANQSLGDIIIFMIKPLYYELKDCLVQGIEKGVNAKSFKSALSIRMSRMKKHILAQAGTSLKDGMFSFIKNFISMLLEGIVNCFVGVFKNIVRMIKEGVKILMQIGPVLMDSNKTMAEKGDALLKLAASSLTIFASIGIETWLNSINIGEPWSIIISSVLTAVLTTLTMYLLDKMDLFGLKKEARLNRIDEILSLKVEESRNEMFTMVNDFA
ncbi:hypothetical protein SL034_003838 [Vibrio harveyi]|nr:hypothetical protein [Vibrio harveyi]